MQDALQAILETDVNLFAYLNNLGSGSFDSFWLWVTNKKTWFPFYGLLLLLVFFKLKNWKLILFFILVTAAMITFVDQTTSSFFKPFFGRFRPCHEPYFDGFFRLVKGSCGGKYSFFSGHSSNSFAVAVYLGLVMKQKKIFLLAMLIWAATVAYSRVYVGVHYPLDIFIGAIWGSLFGYFFYKLFDFIQQKVNSK